MCRSSTRPDTSLHVIQFYQAFPRVSTISDKRWSEKAWVRGYTKTPQKMLYKYMYYTVVLN